MSERHDSRDSEWPSRPWIMAAICAVAGLLFNLLVDVPDAELTALRQAAATLIVIAAVAFVLTVERRRWTWSLGFSGGWGAIVALVGWFTASYNVRGEIFEFPFLAGISAVLLAAPLFQTLRDEGTWRFPYARLHGHAWRDAVIGAASLAFVGITFLLAWLIAGLFDLIGIDVLKDLLGESWFGWMLAGFAFGAAVGLLRERDALMTTLQRLVMVVLGVLAPVLAAALVLFLASLPFTGLGGLWDSSLPATPLMLLAGAGAVLLANAVIGNGEDDRVASPILNYSALALVVVVLPLALIAGLSIAQRIGQYGWTPERMWGVVAVIVALSYGLAGWWAVAKGRANFDDRLRPLQTRLALGLCGLALLLALPIIDFGAISANSQMTRLAEGKTRPGAFDWTAMAFDFGPVGRQRLAEVARTGTREQRAAATAALKAESRYQVGNETEIAASAATIDQRLRLVGDIRLSENVRQVIVESEVCRVGQCVVIAAAPDDWRVVGLAEDGKSARLLRLNPLRTSPSPRDKGVEVAPPYPQDSGTFKRPIDGRTAAIEIRPVNRRQVFVDGQPLGAPFE